MIQGHGMLLATSSTADGSSRSSVVGGWRAGSTRGFALWSLSPREIGSCTHVCAYSCGDLCHLLTSIEYTYTHAGVAFIIAIRIH